MTVVAGLLAGLVAAVLVGCGADGEDGGDPSPGTASPTLSATPSTSPPSGQSPSPSSDPGDAHTPPHTVSPPAPPAPPDSTEQQTLTGRVVSGVEPGCLVLQTARGEYLLLGGEEVYALSEGTTVTVRGHARDYATTCQQGTPFEVSEIVD